MDHMYIRHTLRNLLLLDSKKHNLNYSIEHLNNIWKFTIDISDTLIIEQILDNKNEINIFVVKDGDAHNKTWYYSSEGDIQYDPSKQQLYITVDNKNEYSV
jgi:hypothetical protein